MLLQLQVIILLAIFVGESFSQIVQTPLGSLQGKILVNRKNGQFFAYQSIPYAEPPIGRLRFQKPVKVQPWINTRDATHDVPGCVQILPQPLSGQEDCLHLNVYTQNVTSDTLLPVFVYIHGGGFLIDSGSPTKLGPNYLMTEPIVLVTVNYRLGPFGNIVPNVGFFDQLMALQWVHDNIQSFNGDPNQVTLGGQSAGGLSVHLQLLSGKANNLFQQLILMSGVAINPAAIMKPNYLDLYSQELGFQNTNINETISKMSRLTADQLVNAFVRLNGPFVSGINEPMNVGLYIENSGPNSFVSDYPLNILKSGNYPKVRLLVGFTNQESYLFETFPDFPTWLNLNKTVPFYFTNKTQVVKYIQNFYNISDADIKNKQVLNIRYWDDICFKYHAFRAAKYHNTEDVYFYAFSEHTKLHYLESMNNISYQGAAHTDDLAYVFSNSESQEESGKRETIAIERMVQIYSSFIRFGKPAIAGEITEWPRFNINKRYLVNITKNGLQVELMRRDTTDFWDYIYENFSPGYY